MEDSPRPLRISVDGQPVDARPGDTVAAALLRAGITTFTRSVKYHRPRGPFCLSGSCGQCLMRIDGMPSIPSCQTEVHEGLSCERQNGPLGVDQDLFRAVDFIFAGGLDHHHLMTSSRALGRVTLEVARRLAGLGTLPDAVQAPIAGEVEEAKVAVVGAGPAGLAAARELSRAGQDPLLLEREPSVGGAARLGLSAVALPELLGWGRELEAAGGRVWTSAEVVGLYPQDGQGALLAVRRGARLCLLRAKRVILAVGGAPQPMPFAGVDRPGVYAARGLLALAARSGLRLGSPDGPGLALVGEGAELAACHRELTRAGYGIAGALDCGADEGAPALTFARRGKPLRARGNPVRSLQVELVGGLSETWRCDAVALAHPPAALQDLGASAGAESVWDARLGGCPLVVDAAGRTRVPWLFAAGTVAGQGGLLAAESGRCAASGALSGKGGVR